MYLLHVRRNLLDICGGLRQTDPPKCVRLNLFDARHWEVGTTLDFEEPTSIQGGVNQRCPLHYTPPLQLYRGARRKANLAGSEFHRYFTTCHGYRGRSTAAKAITWRKTVPDFT